MPNFNQAFYCCSVSAANKIANTCYVLIFQCLLSFYQNDNDLNRNYKQNWPTKTFLQNNMPSCSQFRSHGGEGQLYCLLPRGGLFRPDQFIKLLHCHDMAAFNELIEARCKLIFAITWNKRCKLIFVLHRQQFCYINGTIICNFRCVNKQNLEDFLFLYYPIHLWALLNRLKSVS